MAADCCQGHDIKDCPTNLDPSFDRKPPANYKCNFCGKTGRHYGPLCPKHPDPNAIAHQRRKAFFRHSKAGLNNGRQGRRDTQSSRSVRDTSEEFSRLRLTPVFDRQGKRKASRSPSPDRGVPEKKSKAPTGGAKKKTVETVRLGVDDLIERFRRREAPLLNNDKQDERVQGVPEHELGQHSLSPSTPSPPIPSPPTPTSLPMSKVVEVGEAETPISLKSEHASCAIEDQLLELALAEMIQTESVKTDLLLLVNGVERLPPYHPFLLELFRGRESVWVNEASKKTRACPVDFFCFLDEEERAETVDCEMTMDVENVKEKAPVWVLIDEEAADSSSALVEQEEKQAENVDRGEMSVEAGALKDDEPACVLLDVGAPDSATVPREPALQVEATKGDEEMADAEPATSVGAGAILAMLATEPLRNEESLPAATAEGDKEMADVNTDAPVEESVAGAMSIMPVTEILPTEESPSNEAKTEDVGAITIFTADQFFADGVMQAVTPGEPVIKGAGDSEMAGAKLSPTIEDANNLDMAGAESSPDDFVQEATPGEPVTKDARDSKMAGTEPLFVQGSQIGLGTEPSATC